MLLGVIVNALTVALGGVLGTLLSKKLSPKITDAIMTALGLSIVVIGLSGAVKTQDAIVFVLSTVAGVAVGTLLDLDALFERFGKWVERVLFRKKEGEKEGSHGKIAEGFISASLLFCIGAMVIVGALESALSGTHQTFYLKAILDCVSATMLAATLGIGVALSAVTILVVQGAFTLLASLLGAAMDGSLMLNELIAVGNLMIMIIGLNLAKITKVKVANLLPALAFVPLFYYLYHLIF